MRRERLLQVGRRLVHVQHGQAQFYGGQVRLLEKAVYLQQRRVFLEQWTLQLHLLLCEIVDKANIPQYQEAVLRMQRRKPRGNQLDPV